MFDTSVSKVRAIRDHTQLKIIQHVGGGGERGEHGSGAL